MKNKGLFFGSLIGGALLGSALTILCHSKKAGAMRMRAHEKIMHELEHMRAHLCQCKDGSCSLEGMEGMSEEMSGEQVDD
ncbi:MAG: hypothetical protein SNH01_08240 [Rikenellaceae bacterium]